MVTYEFLNAPYYKEHQKEYFNHKLLKKRNISLFCIYENNNFLSIDFYVKLIRSYLSFLK